MFETTTFSMGLAYRHKGWSVLVPEGLSKVRQTIVSADNVDDHAIIGLESTLICLPEDHPVEWWPKRLKLEYALERSPFRRRQMHRHTCAAADLLGMDLDNGIFAFLETASRTIPHRILQVSRESNQVVVTLSVSEVIGRIDQPLTLAPAA